MFGSCLRVLNEILDKKNVNDGGKRMRKLYICFRPFGLLMSSALQMIVVSVSRICCHLGLFPMLLYIVPLWLTIVGGFVLFSGTVQLTLR